MKLSEMKELLQCGGIQLTKSLGQNFLHDSNQLRRIVSEAGLSTRDRVLEIGPGLGPLTELLLAEAGEVLSVEIDQRLCAILRKRFTDHPRFTLVHDDALRYVREHREEWAGWKMVSNLPYSVASPILVELAQASPGPERMVATLQGEVVHRLTAQAGDPDYGLLTLLVQLSYIPKGSFKIPPSCFFPEPDVESACITLERRPEPLLSGTAARTFKRLVKRAFSQRRKMMLKLLKADWPLPQLEAAFSGLNISRQIRAEAVTLDQFVLLARKLDTPRLGEAREPQ